MVLSCKGCRNIEIINLNNYIIQVKGAHCSRSSTRGFIMEIKKILLPFDDSVHSVNAANCTITLARQIGATVTIVHCYEWMPSITEVPSPLIKDLDEVCKKKAKDVLKTAEEIFRDRGIDYSLEAVLGSPGKVLVDLAKEGTYDLIVMGSKGHSDIAGILIGSVTHRLVNSMYCPVLVVP